MNQKSRYNKSIVQWSPYGITLDALALRCNPRKGLCYSRRAAQVGLRLAQAQQERSAPLISALPEY